MSFPAIKKYIIDPYYMQNPEETLEGSKTEENTETDGEEEVNDQPKSEYVYHNGRMIHRSALEEDALFDDSLKIGANKDNQ